MTTYYSNGTIATLDGVFFCIFWKVLFVNKFTSFTMATIYQFLHDSIQREEIICEHYVFIR
jgi:hypothetical protein